MSTQDDFSLHETNELVISISKQMSGPATDPAGHCPRAPPLPHTPEKASQLGFCSVQLFLKPWSLQGEKLRNDFQ